jgi:hypothetical protein
MGYLAVALGVVGQPSSLAATLRTQRRVLGPDHPETLASSIFYARSLICAGTLGEADLLLRDVLCAFRRIHGDAHADTLQVLKMLMEVRMKRSVTK